jgi:hypothetical protein
MSAMDPKVMEDTVCPECGEISNFSVRVDCTQREWEVLGHRDEKAYCAHCDCREEGENLTKRYKQKLVRPTQFGNHLLNRILLAEQSEWIDGDKAITEDSIVETVDQVQKEVKN